MFNTIGVAIASFFTMLATLFNAGNKAAAAVDHVAGWAEESAATFHEEAKSNREISLDEAAFAREQRKKELQQKRVQYDAKVAAEAATGGPNKKAGAAAATTT